MRLNIYSLKRTLWTGEAKSLNCAATGGEITVLDNHRPLITILAAGMISVVDYQGAEHYFPVRQGILEVKPDNHARLIVEE